MIDPTLGENPFGRVVPDAKKFFKSAERYLAQGNAAAADQCLTAALRIDPNYVDALCSMSALLGDHRRQYATALALAQRAANIQPGNPAVLCNLGTALFRVDRYEEAARLQMVAIKIANDWQAAHDAPLVRPIDLTAFWHNLGLARIAMGKPAEGAECMRRAMAISPDQIMINKELALAQLGAGDYEQGLPTHEARWLDLMRYPIWDSGIALWTGQDLSGKTIIVHHEQGAGDTIQFCRFLPRLRASGARVIAALPQPLMRLLAISGLVDDVVEINGVLPPADYHVPMMSVPSYLGLTVDTIPGEPYLKAPAEGFGIPIRKPDGTRLTIGLVWAGAAGYVPDMRRSMPFEKFLPLLDVPQLNFVSLQKGERAGDLKTIGDGGLIPDLSGFLGDFADTAAALMQIDILVSVDTAPLHLAGALGRPCIALLSKWRCWRWLTDRTDSPYYPTMQFAQQETAGDWDGVIERVKQMILEADIEEEVENVVSYPLTPALPRADFLVLAEIKMKVKRGVDTFQITDGRFAQDLGVRYANGGSLIPVQRNPDVGQYVPPIGKHGIYQISAKEKRCWLVVTFATYSTEAAVSEAA